MLETPAKSERMQSAARAAVNHRKVLVLAKAGRKELAKLHQIPQSFIIISFSA